jgi:uncharacterized membrane protein YdjX (TVP38/TMEM64 family)
MHSHFAHQRMKESMGEKIREISSGNSKKAKIVRTLLLLITALLFFLIILYCIKTFIPDILALLKDGNHEEIENYLRQEGKKGALVLIILQVLQTITIVFPGIPIYVASGIVYGKLVGTIICYVTYVVSNAGVFLFARRMGELSESFFRSGKKNKNEDYTENLLRKTKHPCYVVAALCVIPVIPNGIIPHIASRTGMTFKQFTAAIAVGCLPGIFLFIMCGSLILDGHIMLLVILCIIALALMILMMLFKNKLIGFLSSKFKVNEDEEKNN